MTDFPTPTMIKTNGIDMAVYEAGPKDGLPVVLCHGFPELAYSWRHQLPALAAAGFRVLAPDQRGYGLTSNPDRIEDYDMAHLTGDLAGLRDRLLLFARDTSLRERLGDQGRQFVRERFSVERMVDDLFALYLKLSSGHKMPPS